MGVQGLHKFFPKPLVLVVGWVIWEFVVKTQVPRDFTALIDKGN